MLDEVLSVYIALQCPYVDKGDLVAFTRRLSISLEVVASGSPPRGAQNAPHEDRVSRQEDSIWRGTLVAAEEPVLVPVAPSAGQKGSLIAVWEIKALLSLLPNVRSKYARLKVYRQTKDQTAIAYNIFQNFSCTQPAR